MPVSSQRMLFVVTVTEPAQAIKPSLFMHVYTRECEETAAAATGIPGLIEHLSNSQSLLTTLQKLTLSTGKARSVTCIFYHAIKA